MGEIDGEVAFQVASMCLESQAPYLALAMVNLLSGKHLLGHSIIILCRNRKISPIVPTTDGDGSRLRRLVAARLFA